MEPITANVATAFESETCSRCGGSGRYSYCQMYGDRCFRCGGKGRTLTKRGAAANKYCVGLRSRNILDLKPGESYRMDGIPGFSGDVWVTVESFEVRDDGYVTVHGKGGNFTVPGNTATVVRVRQSKESAAATFAAALEYQATLTKAGTVRVRTGGRTHVAP